MLLSIATAAAWVGEEHHVAMGCQVIELVHEGIAVLHLRATVNLQDGRIFLFRIEARRSQDPALQIVLVSALVPNLAHLAEIDALQPGVDVRQLARLLSSQIQPIELARIIQFAEEIKQLLPIRTELVRPNHTLSRDDVLQIAAIRLHRFQLHRTMMSDLEIQPLAVRRPGGQHLFRAAAVADGIHADVQVVGFR